MNYDKKAVTKIQTGLTLRRNDAAKTYGYGLKPDPVGNDVPFEVLCLPLRSLRRRVKWSRFWSCAGFPELKSRSTGQRQ
jgi:hypothetical protein